MLKSELLKLIESIEDSEEVDEVLKGTDFAKSMLSLDNFKNLVATNPVFKSFWDSEKDKHAEKYNKTWQDNHLPKLIDDGINEKYYELHPEDKPKDPIVIKALEDARASKELAENLQRKLKMKDLKTIAIKAMSEKDLNKYIDLIDCFVGEDEETTIKTLEMLEQIRTNDLETAMSDRIKKFAYTPPVGGTPTTNNPWSKEHFNLTKQAQILKENPELAEQLKSVVK